MKKSSISFLTQMTIALGFLLLLGSVKYSHAQPLLDYCSSYTSNSSLPEDRMIGEEITDITITVRGADGGHAIIDGGLCTPKMAKGGSAATMVATFPIGSSSNYLQPGGILRTFKGSKGADHQVNCGKDAFAGGGGSSAVVYLPPGKDPSGPNWKLLMVAGGGGGGANLGGSAQHKGLGANDTEKGDDVDGGQAGVNGGCSGSHTDGSLDLPGHPGGSVFCFGLGRRGGSMVEFINGNPHTDGNGSYGLLQNSKLNYIGGKPGTSISGYIFDLGYGGPGFTGGAAGHGGGGGGGGYSGGAGSTKNGGGGGGSYINGSFNPTFSSKTPGTDGGSTKTSGFVTLSWSQSNAGTCGEISPACNDEITFASSTTGDDLIIPAGINSLEINLKGGDGGDANSGFPGDGGCPVKNLKGGEGATIIATFDVGNTGNRLRPGGKLRYYTGQSGRDMNPCIVGFSLSYSVGGGGGSSALLYQAPGEFVWKVLAIAGGGGGGTYLPEINLEYQGVGGQSSENGAQAAGTGFAGSPSNPCPQGFFNSNNQLAAAAGGTFNCSNGQGAWGGTAGFGDVNNSTADPAHLTGGVSDPQNTFDILLRPNGGDGFQGGGAGLLFGGGGGGYYGGALGGGGGSFFNTGFIHSGLQKVTGATGGGSSATGYVTVKFTGVNPPTAVCKNATVHLDSNGNGSISVSDIDNGSTGSCSGIAGYALDQTTFNCSHIGSNMVTLTVTDNNSNSSTCTATVTVTDAIAPTAACTGLTVQLDANGSATLSVSDVNSGSSDNCGIAGLAVSPASFGCSNVGSNTVTLTATDGSGNSSTCTAAVTVEDNVAPSAKCQDATVQLDAAGNGTVVPDDINNGSSDACGIANMAISPSDFDCAHIGTNTVTLMVTDSNGNSSSCTSTVTVEDNVAPAAICQDVTVQLDATGNGSTTAAAINNGSSDACGIAGYALSETSFDCSHVGTNSVTLTVTDNNGNSSSCTATVTVEDNVAPSAVCQGVTVQLDATGNGSTTAAAINNGSSDACGIAGYSLSQMTFDCSHVGDNPVTLSVTDIHGNVGTCNATVTVEDLVAPVISSELIFLGCDPEENEDQYEVAGSAADNCGVDGDSYVIALPPMEFPTMEFKKKNNKKLHFLFNQNKIIVDAPGVGGAEAWWDEIEGQGGVAVSLGQVFGLSGEEGSNSINYLFDTNGELKKVTAFSMTMVHHVTDLSGNLTSETFTVSRQCESGSSTGSSDSGSSSSSMAQEKSEVDMQAYPNPFRDQVTIEFELSKEGAIQLEVFDLSGKQVRVLLNESLPEGRHSTVWDGNGPGGQLIKPGTYFLRLKTSEEVITKQLVLIR